MRVLFTSSSIGSSFDFIASTEENEIRKILPENEEDTSDCLFVPSKEYFEITKLFGLEYRSFPPERFVKACNSIAYNSENLPWQFILPKEIYKTELKIYIQSVLNDLQGIDINYYTNSFKKQNIVLDNLERAAIDLQRFEAIMNSANDEGASNVKTILKSFGPDKLHNGIWFAALPEYERLGTVTGRLRINKGPNILLLKKEYRQVLKSRWGKDGNIFYLDFKSLEPRTLLSLKNDGVNIPIDPYTYVAKKIGLDEQKDRNAVKTAIISMMYGAGDKELKKQIGSLVSYPDDFIASVKEQFGVESLREQLKEQYENNGSTFIKNLYDRPIFGSGIAPYVLVNYFIQSTAVDIALFGFSKIVEKIIQAKATKMICPIFILHDALILDVHKDAQVFLPKLAKLGSTGIPKFENMRFWIEIEKIS